MLFFVLYYIPLALIAGETVIEAEREGSHPFSHHEYGLTVINAKGMVVKPESRSPLRYLSAREIDRRTAAELAKLRVGATRSMIARSWRENGGLIPCEWFVAFRGEKVVAVRIQWRPAAMPLRIAMNSGRRLAWLRLHAPVPSRGDVIERVSKPYFSKYALD
jgi:hypothetical protein